MDDPTIRRLLDWWRENGAPEPVLEIRGVPGAGRGMFAIRDIEPNKPIVQVPRNLLVSRAAVLSKWCSVLTKSPRAARLSEHCVLAAFLVLLKLQAPCVAPSVHEFWAPYLATVPTQFTNLFFDEAVYDCEFLPQDTKRRIETQIRTAHTDLAAITAVLHDLVDQHLLPLYCQPRLCSSWRCG
ncbi:hypothetical protein AMAG_01058 [Allomyces macrogynus ATCC 38327]|uniref:SET domain-containing protein n=1 Tax=Allomyces macrogynus (strain ATCC 38327) TaxID=578462 RepID=A0A0L0RXR9_ALLM3|nr:hypothetical protein AMAG_01058 [Allomyces macrogynus ATCC 38327]|eukprot:KNE55133.1 hypothetical protein AMAG_01058 [Allomyces macrogynus ATCC 38327]